MTRFRCPIDGCNAPLRIGTLMCLRHWRMVPQANQRLVNKTWRESEMKATGLRVDVDRYSAYVAARNQVIEVVNAQVRKDAPICD